MVEIGLYRIELFVRINDDDAKFGDVGIRGSMTTACKEWMEEDAQFKQMIEDMSLQVSKALDRVYKGSSKGEFYNGPGTAENTPLGRYLREEGSNEAETVQQPGLPAPSSVPAESGASMAQESQSG